ncbi:MAG: hypothetical protein WCJ60_02285 [bacterium]
MTEPTEPTLLDSEIKKTLALFTTRIYLEGGNNADEITDEAVKAIKNLLLEAQIAELKAVSFYINTRGESFTDYYTERLAELQSQLGVSK